ncbi:MAG TPA: ChaB family protein [Woeseiaceae bacterium]|nr:ChaB family protein [Woeseiaceae bacterium]
MYQTIHELPASIRNGMPEQACELYVAVYNRISDKRTRHGEDDPAAIAQEAHDGAMLAVQAEFEIGDDGEWRRAPIGLEMERLGKANPDRQEGTGRD